MNNSLALFFSLVQDTIYLFSVAELSPPPPSSPHTITTTGIYRLSSERNLFVLHIEVNYMPAGDVRTEGDSSKF